ncbi:hypothetical protein ACFWBB_16635 [Streptomyces sp. NPDC060000]
MPRSVWCGAIWFGLVTAPFSVVRATGHHWIRLWQDHLELCRWKGLWS